MRRFLFYILKQKSNLRSPSLVILQRSPQMIDIPCRIPYVVSLFGTATLCSLIFTTIITAIKIMLCLIMSNSQMGPNAPRLSSPDRRSPIALCRSQRFVWPLTE